MSVKVNPNLKEESVYFRAASNVNDLFNVFISTPSGYFEYPLKQAVLKPGIIKKHQTVKDQQTDKFYTQAAVLGVVAGMRAMSAPAIALRMVTHAAAKGDVGDVPVFLQSDTTNVALSLLAIAEFVGDKLPNIPNRTATPGLIARCVSGGLSGAAICKVNKQNAVIGALIGATAALASSFGCFHLRRTIVKSCSLPDPTIGAIEDALVMSTGLGLVSLS